MVTIKCQLGDIVGVVELIIHVMQVIGFESSLLIYMSRLHEVYA